MTSKYYAVCYAHVCRWEKASSPEEALKKAFGVDAVPWRMLTVTIQEFPSNPKYLSHIKRQRFLDSLYARHKEETGQEIK